MMYSEVVPPAGGETEFADMYAAYDNLPPAMKKKIEGKRAIHNLDFSRTRRHGEDPMTAEQKAKVPPIAHPIVRTHPKPAARRSSSAITRRRSRAWTMTRAAPLIEELNVLITPPAQVYTHVWSPRECMVWGQSLHLAPCDRVRRGEPRAGDAALHDQRRSAVLIAAFRASADFFSASRHARRAVHTLHNGDLTLPRGARISILRTTSIAGEYSASEGRTPKQQHWSRMSPKILVVSPSAEVSEIAREMAPKGFETIVVSDAEVTAALPGTEYMVCYPHVPMRDAVLQGGAEAQAGAALERRLRQCRPRSRAARQGAALQQWRRERHLGLRARADADAHRLSQGDLAARQRVGRALARQRTGAAHVRAL
jgi:hypothetical protein